MSESMLARNLHLMRKEQQLSLRKLANRSGLSPSTVFQIEQGKANPSVSVLEKLAEALKVSVFDLTGWEITPQYLDQSERLADWYQERKGYLGLREEDLDAISSIHFRNWKPHSFAHFDLLFLILSFARGEIL